MNSPERQRSQFEEPFNLRLGKSIDFLLNLQRDIRHREVIGKENLDKLEAGESVIIAASHSTGFDIPLIVDAIGDRLEVAISDQSTHHHFGREHSAFFGQKVAGAENFIPISYSWKDGKKSADPFNPLDAMRMAEALDDGRSVVVAAHNPLIVDSEDKPIQPKPGYLAAYLAALSGHRVLPIAIDYTPIEKSKKYDATINVGQPFDLNALTDASEILSLFRKRQTDGLDAVESRNLVQELNRLRQDGGTIFSKVQSLQKLEFGYPVIDNAHTKSKIGKSAVSSPNSFPKLR